MRKPALAFGLAFGSFFWGHVIADGFTGPYDVSNWSITAPVGGEIDTFNAPSYVILYGPDLEIGGELSYTISAVASGDWSFSWLYTSSDAPEWDGAGYLLNGIYTELASSSGASGALTISVLENDIIGFLVRSEDGILGPGVFTVSEFSAPTEASPVPESGTWCAALVLGGIVCARLRTQRQP